jgi:hypothetical protein
MRPYILTEPQAGRVPRVLLVFLCIAFLIPGFTGRDPWGSADATGFGIALTMARGSIEQWLQPSVFGLGLPEEAPLAHWLMAGAMRLGSPWLSEHASARLAVGLLVAPGLWAIWQAARLFARRPEIQPSDPFGASASPALIARSMADATLLVTLACWGLVTRLHETTAEALQFTWMGILLWGAALSLVRPRTGGSLVGLALAATVLGGSVLLAVLLASAWFLAYLLSRPIRALARNAIAGSVLWPVGITGLWALSLWVWDGRTLTALGAWWTAAWAIAPVGGGSLSGLLGTLSWFAWPAWPLAVWTLWRWRKLAGEPALLIPTLFAAAILIHLSLIQRASEQAMIPLIMPLALLAVWGLPTMMRGMVALLDWMAVSLFSLIGIFIWGYWLALQTGYPPRMAASALRVAPGYEPEFVTLSGAVGLAASIGWLVLIRWRTRNGPPRLWRPMVLSAGGLVFVWILLVSLWLPVFDQRKSLRGPALEAAEVIRGVSEGPSGRVDCVQALNLSTAERTGFAYFGGIPFGTESQPCPLVLQRLPSEGSESSLTGKAHWERLWLGGRRFDRKERFALDRRQP